VSQSTDTATLEPVPHPPERGAVTELRRDPLGWVRRNLFQTLGSGVATVVAGAIAIAIAIGLVRFLFGSDWTIIRVNLTNFMVGSFPRDELYRPWAAVWLVALFAGGLAGSGVRANTSPRALLPRIAPGLALVVVLLLLTQTPTPALLTLAAVALAVAGYLIGRRLPARAHRWRPLALVVMVLLVFTVLVGFDGVGWADWGGLLLTLYLAVGAILLSFPLGVLLALGRRSSLPAVRAVCVLYIELFRGVPLVTVLFMGQFMLGFFLPAALRPENVTRALAAFTLFTAAYVAEVVRGGLQGVPPGQTEAAQAVGLSPSRTTFLIVLPQGLRNVIPALVGQFISLFKDTSLAAAIGLTELLAVAQLVNTQPQFLGQGLQAQTLLFASFVYWAFCYSMSRASQRLERRLGVGER
jgi:general L-amino acid transport system permease protein